jgi:SAM-dependent methyltransferase
MDFLTQSRFPRLWLLMQNTIGGNLCKQKMATEFYLGQKRVLEIGCSVGNVSAVFRAFSNVVFTGIDIDRHAIDLARRRFQKEPNFRFCLSSLQELSRQGENFDYVLFAGILHHVDDSTSFQLLRDAVKLTASGGRLVIYEPEAVRELDGWFLRCFYSLFEQGVFLRSRDDLLRLVESGGIDIETVEERMISPGIIKRPFIARFNLLSGVPAGKTRMSM